MTVLFATLPPVSSEQKDRDAQKLSFFLVLIFFHVLMMLAKDADEIIMKPNFSRQYLHMESTIIILEVAGHRARPDAERNAWRRAKGMVRKWVCAISGTAKREKEKCRPSILPTASD